MNEDRDPGAGEDTSPGAAEAGEVHRRTEERLAGLAALDVAEHLAVFDAVQRDLTEVLRGLDEDEAPGPGRR